MIYEEENIRGEKVKRYRRLMIDSDFNYPPTEKEEVLLREKRLAHIKDTEHWQREQKIAEKDKNYDYAKYCREQIRIDSKMAKAAQIIMIYVLGQNNALRFSSDIDYEIMKNWPVELEEEFEIILDFFYLNRP